MFILNRTFWNSLRSWATLRARRERENWDRAASWIGLPILRSHRAIVARHVDLGDEQVIVPAHKSAILKRRHAPLPRLRLGLKTPRILMPRRTLVAAALASDLDSKKAAQTAFALTATRAHRPPESLTNINRCGYPLLQRPPILLTDPSHGCGLVVGTIAVPTS
jgi:hypothetical protein